MTATKTTCQICGRPIKANTGLVAHHGYKRPGEGWQTSSCMGARHLPYELSCDVLPRAIKSCEAYIAGTQAAFDDAIANPPATLTDYSRHAWDHKPPPVYVRPVDFDPAKNMTGSYSPHTYAGLWASTQYKRLAQLKGSAFTLTYLQDRLTKWVAPS